MFEPVHNDFVDIEKSFCLSSDIRYHESGGLGRGEARGVRGEAIVLISSILLRAHLERYCKMYYESFQGIVNIL